MDGDKKELIQHLFDASNNNKKFQERFQSFLDQIPKPSGASAAPEKEKFFMNFFLGMFSSLKSAGLDRTLRLEDCCFNLVSIIKMKDELHVAAKIKSEKGDTVLLVNKKIIKISQVAS
ncbi:hypothetical protein [Wolbachia endosymbiont (group A) of Sphaerophoria taeniata]|uniref:hypothetical protein n=1 Tax=Wolbachia endosymbiont (group A) of Sphaerophoria taeniata TaxID=2954057 RepID=UPI002226B6F9|nr:hypothetical protein [Wolbachia endosymbiont (group A) of Sphaerophoria taeniata]